MPTPPAPTARPSAPAASPVLAACLQPPAAPPPSPPIFWPLEFSLFPSSLLRPLGDSGPSSLQRSWHGAIHSHQLRQLLPGKAWERSRII